MPDALSRPKRRKRSGQDRSRALELPAVFRICHPRPTLLDRRLRGDAWVLAESDQTSGIYFGNYCLTCIGSTTFDLPTFNRLLDMIRVRGCK